jgi:hypothetical protein
MPVPSLAALVLPLGNFSRYGILWSSVGASPAYEIFAGCAEVLGGVFLVFPRTTMLGALVAMADMTEVWMLNMTYDVPVKLFSFHLLLFALFLLAPEAGRLADFCLRNRTAEPSAQPQLFSTRRANQLALGAQIMLGVWLLGTNARADWNYWHTHGGGHPRSALYGIWNVDELSTDGQLRPPLLDDSSRWRRAIFDVPDRMMFQRLDDSLAGYDASIDVKLKTIVLTKKSDRTWMARFAFQRMADDKLILDGDMDGHRIHMWLHQADRGKIRLVNSGFHWIQEY